MDEETAKKHDKMMVAQLKKLEHEVKVLKLNKAELLQQNSEAQDEIKKYRQCIATCL